VSRGKEKAAARVAQEIVERIRAEGLQPGDRYLSEAEALQRHGVSRATFRESLRFLEMLGVVRVRTGPGGGAIVRWPGPPHLASALALLLQFRSAPLSSVLDARAVIEPSIAAEAATNATPEMIATLRRHLAEAEQRIEDQPAFAAAYRAFWEGVAAATGNPILALLWPALRALTDSGGFIPSADYRTQLVGRMRVLLAAIEAGGAAEAAAIIAALDSEFARRLTASYPERMARPLAWSEVSIDGEGP